MQRAAEMEWSMPKTIGDAPSRRSGHSFVLIGDFGYLFGGNDFRKPPGPNNDLYKLDISGNEFFWSKIASTGRHPEPRSNHTATRIYNGSKMLLFGGFRSSSIRYNDVWMFDINSDEYE